MSARRPDGLDGALADLDDPAGIAACSTDGECITCGDVAVPLTVVSVSVTGTDARCRDADGREESVALEFVGPVGVGDRVLVHAGVAIELLPAAPAEPAEPVSEG